MTLIDSARRMQVAGERPAQGRQYICGETAVQRHPPTASIAPSAFPARARHGASEGACLGSQADGDAMTVRLLTAIAARCSARCRTSPCIAW